MVTCPIPCCRNGCRAFVVNKWLMRRILILREIRAGAAGDVRAPDLANLLILVIPAKAGISIPFKSREIPAFAGMTARRRLARGPGIRPAPPADCRSAGSG